MSSTCCMRRYPPILPAGSVIYFQDVYDHTVRVLDSIDIYRDLLSVCGCLFVGTEQRLYQVMRRLTVISTILPLTFLSALFGMTLDSLPFHEPLGVLVQYRHHGVDADHHDPLVASHGLSD